MEIKSLECPDIADPETWQPDSLEQVFFAVALIIGPVDEPGGHIFQITVATPEALRVYLEAHNVQVFPAPHFLIVRDYDWNALRAALNDLVAQCERATWEASVEQLCRYFLWEYADHHATETTDYHMRFRGIDPVILDAILRRAPHFFTYDPTNPYHYRSTQNLDKADLPDLDIAIDLEGLVIHDNTGDQGLLAGIMDYLTAEVAKIAGDVVIEPVEVAEDDEDYLYMRSGAGYLMTFVYQDQAILDAILRRTPHFYEHRSGNTLTHPYHYRSVENLDNANLPDMDVGIGPDGFHIHVGNAGQDFFTDIMNYLQAEAEKIADNVTIEPA